MPTSVSNATTIDKIDELIRILQNKRDEWKGSMRESNDSFTKQCWGSLVTQTSESIASLCILANWLDPES